MIIVNRKDYYPSLLLDGYLRNDIPELIDNIAMRYTKFLHILVDNPCGFSRADLISGKVCWANSTSNYRKR